MAKGSTPKVNVPTYESPTPDNYYSPYGNVTYKNGGFNVEQSQGDQDFNTMLQATRAALLKTIGTTSQDQENSLNEWQKTYFDEAQRLSQPQLENSLFERGMGGSNLYTGSLNDLISKNANAAILNKYTLANQDQATKLNNFNGVNTAYNNNAQNSYNLLNLASNAAANKDSLATSRYQSTLPYLVSYDGGQSDGYGQIIGTVGGGLAGLAMGNPIMGAQIGSTLGGAVDGGMGNTSVGSQFINPALTAAGGFSNLIKPTPALQTGAFGKAGAAYNRPDSTFMNSALMFK